MVILLLLYNYQFYILSYLLSFVLFNGQVVVLVKVIMFSLISLWGSRCLRGARMIFELNASSRTCLRLVFKVVYWNTLVVGNLFPWTSLSSFSSLLYQHFSSHQLVPPTSDVEAWPTPPSAYTQPPFGITHSYLRPTSYISYS